MVGLMVTCSKRAYATHSTSQVCYRPLLTHASSGSLKHSKVCLAQSFVGSLGPGAHKVCLSPLRVSDLGFDSKCDFVPSTVFLVLLFSLPLDVGFLFLVGSNILLSMAVQQLLQFWSSHKGPDAKSQFIRKDPIVGKD